MLACHVLGWHKNRHSLGKVSDHPELAWSVDCDAFEQHWCRVMMMGPPLSGKTSHSQALSASLGLPLIQVGPLLHAQAAAGDGPLQAALQGDALVPDAMYLEAVSQRLKQEDCIQAGWLLDGFPHTLAQVGAL